MEELRRLISFITNSHLLTPTNSHITIGLIWPFVWPGHESWEFQTRICKLKALNNAYATLVLVWPKHESWENSHTNSRLSTLINTRATLALLWPGQQSWESSHTTLVLVGPGHESWEDLTRYCVLTLINFHASRLRNLSSYWVQKILASQILLVLVEKRGSWEISTIQCNSMQFKLWLVSSHHLSCNSCFRLTGAEWRPSDTQSVTQSDSKQYNYPHHEVYKAVQLVRLTSNHKM